MSKVNFIIIAISFCLSCRYSAPLIKFNKEFSQRMNSDSTTIKKLEFIDYRYFRPSVYGIFGGYSIKKYYDANDQLIKLTKVKQKVWGLYDGTQRTKSKTFYYKDSKVYRKDYKITQAYGFGGRLVVDKTILYEDEWTKKKINNKKNNGGFILRVK